MPQGMVPGGRRGPSNLQRWIASGAPQRLMREREAVRVALPQPAQPDQAPLWELVLRAADAAAPDAAFASSVDSVSLAYAPGPAMGGAPGPEMAGSGPQDALMSAPVLAPAVAAARLDMEPDFEGRHLLLEGQPVMPRAMQPDQAPSVWEVLLAATDAAAYAPNTAPSAAESPLQAPAAVPVSVAAAAPEAGDAEPVQAPASYHRRLLQADQSPASSSGGAPSGAASWEQSRDAPRTPAAGANGFQELPPRLSYALPRNSAVNNNAAQARRDRPPLLHPWRALVAACDDRRRASLQSAVGISYSHALDAIAVKAWKNGMIFYEDANDRNLSCGLWAGAFTQPAAMHAAGQQRSRRGSCVAWHLCPPPGPATASPPSWSGQTRVPGRPRLPRRARAPPPTPQAPGVPSLLWTWPAHEAESYLVLVLCPPVPWARQWCCGR